MTVVIFGDIEVALADYLAAALADRGVDVPVLAKVPPQRPKRFVLVVRVGGTQSNLVTDRPRVVAECWDTIGTGAHDLAALVRGLLTSLAPGYVSGIWVERVAGVGLSRSPDPDTGLPRYLVPAELHITGTPLS